MQKKDPEHLEEHKQRRLEHKSASQCPFFGRIPDSGFAENTRYTNPLKSKFRAKRLAAEIDGGAAMPTAKRPAVQMPDEYLPPNKILFLQNLPESVTKDQLNALFSQCVYHLWFHDRNADRAADTPTYTKFVLSPRKKTSRSWSTWTREVRAWQRTPCTITS